MGFLGSYPDEQQLPPWFSSVYANAPSGGSDPAAPPAVDPGAGKTATPAAHPGFFGRIGQAIHSPEFRFRLQAALANASGNPQAAMQYMEFAQQQGLRQQELQRQLRAEQRTEEDRNNQVWGLKQLNYSNPQIAAMNTADASHSVQTRSDPYTMSAGQTHVVPGLGGQSDQVTAAPNENQQNYGWLNGIDPTLGRAFAEKQAYPSPVPITQGGGVAGYGTTAPHYLVQPDTAPQGAASPSPAAGAATDQWGRMIRQESGGRQFDRNGAPLRSSAGAIGIAQIMPGTGPEAARYAGVPYDPARLASDPQYNAQLGQAYYQHLLQQFGDPAQAAAAYNAGPGRVARAIQRGGANWQNYIPQETRNYVAAVTGQGGATAQSATRAVSNSAAMQQARAAIRMGADPAAVRARLRQAGVSDAGL